MSATIERTSPGTRWGALSRDNGLDLDVKDLRRPREYYYRLASESSRASEDDTESVYSIQDKETDVVRDTSDTESQIESDFELEFEYEVASLSGSNHGTYISSSDPEDIVLAAAVIYQSDLEATMTDGEDSDSSSDHNSFERTGFVTCALCRGKNDNPLYRYCEKCFQDRKRFFPPRPRSKRKQNVNPSNGWSQDSGLGSSQECPPLDLGAIKIPEKIQNKMGMSKTENLSGCSTESLRPVVEVESDASLSTNKSVTKGKETRLTRKRSRSDEDSSESERDSKKIKTTSDLGSDTGSTLTTTTTDKSSFSSESSSGVSSLSGSSSSQERASGSELETDLCVFCNSAPKDSIFLHTNIAHRCCCYQCAKKTLQKFKRCPICNRSVNKIVKIFTS